MTLTLSLRICFTTSEGWWEQKHSLSFYKLSQLNLFSLLAAKLHLSSAAYTQFVYKYMWGVMPGLCLAGESPEIQGFSLLQKTLSGILGQKVVQQPQQTTTSLEKPATKREREGEGEG